jgi:AcrR family transcriptional regulator
VTDGSRKTRTPRKERRERSSITAEEIVSGAYALAAEVTVEKLSMSALARRLDIGVMSIYWYFRSKEDLLAAMRESALEKYELALPFVGAGEWHELLREHFLAMRDLFRENPVLCDLVIMQTLTYGDVPNRVIFERLESILATLVDAGFRPEDALDTYYSLALHSRGFAMLERHEAVATASWVGPLELDNASMPILSSLTQRDYSLKPMQDHLFEAGLDALIDRAKRVLAAG